MEKYYYEKKQENRDSDSDEYVRKEDLNKTPTQQSSASKNYSEKPNIEETEKDQNNTSNYKKTRNYFIHFPFYTSKKFYSCIDEFRSKVGDIDDYYKDFFYQQKFHVTLTMLFKLDDDQKDRVVEIIKENAESLK